MSVKFKSSAGKYTVTESYRLFGLLFLAVGGFAGYILYFRPDVHGEVNALIKLFRVIFPAGFGFGGVWLLSSGRKTVIDAGRGTFLWRETGMFRTSSREGSFSSIKRVLLSAERESYTSHDNPERVRYRWAMTLSLDIGDGALTMAKWTRDIGYKRPANEGVEEAKARASELAALIGCPLVFPAQG